MLAHLQILALCGLIASMPTALAGFSSGATDNIAVYWGQNSVNRVGGQQRLATYCSNTPVNIIPLAFLATIKNPTSVNFANAGDNCTTFPGTQLLRCPQIEQDIQTCQSLGKTVLLSLGGATYTEGGFTSPSEASTWASTLWSMFGPVSGSDTTAVLRPFGAASVDGFDMDFEAGTSNMPAFAAALRQRMDASTASTGRRYFLSAAPQCPFPDAAMGEMINSVGFDFVSVQFYNNYCGAGGYGAGGPGSFNFARWDQWARGGESPNPRVKVLVGLPGSPTAAGSGYVAGEQLKAAVQYARGFASFGGVMVWDMSQVYGNSGFLDTVVSALGGHVPVTTTTASATSTTTSRSATTFSTTTTSAAPTGTLVPQWGQCGGRGYLGPTQCQPPYTCVAQGEWWSQCM